MLTDFEAVPIVILYTISNNNLNEADMLSKGICSENLEISQSFSSTSGLVTIIRMELWKYMVML